MSKQQPGLRTKLTLILKDFKPNGLLNPNEDNQSRCLRFEAKQSQDHS